MRKTTLKTLIILSLGFYSCSRADLLNPPKNIDNFARNFVTILQNESNDSILSYVDKDQVQIAKDFLIKVSEQLKFKVLKGVKVLSYGKTSFWFTKDKGYAVYNTDYEFNYDNLYYGFTISVLEKENKLSIVGFNATLFDRPIQDIYSFSFSNIRTIHIVFLIFMILTFGFIVFTITDIVKTKLKRKWLWIIISLIGFCGLTLNWTTGDIHFKFFIIKLLGVGFSKSGNVAPWIISLTIPIGSIIYWIKKPDILFNLELEEDYKRTNTES